MVKPRTAEQRSNAPTKTMMMGKTRGGSISSRDPKWPPLITKFIIIAEEKIESRRDLLVVWHHGIMRDVYICV